MTRSCKPIATIVGAVTLLLMLPSSASACNSWDIGGMSRDAKQSNGYILGLNFQQAGNALSGSGYYYPVGEGMGPRTPGQISGSINGSEFQFTMKWSNGGKGIYTGFVADDGTISGNTRDAKNRNSRATWYAPKPQKAKCLG